MPDYTPTSTLGLTLDRMRWMIAASSEFQMLCGVNNTLQALDRVVFEDPFEFSEGPVFDLPKAYILRADLQKQHISGGNQPQLFPSASSITVLLKFWPDAVLHDEKDSHNEWLKAQDVGGKIYDQLTGSLNGTDISVSVPVENEEESEVIGVALPSIIGSSCMVYDSRADGIEDVSSSFRNYRYYYQSYMSFEVLP